MLREIVDYEMDYDEEHLIPHSKQWGKGGKNLYPFNGESPNFSPDIESYFRCAKCAEDEKDGKLTYFECHLFQRVGLTKKGFQVWCERHGNVITIPLPEPEAKHLLEEFDLCDCQQCQEKRK